MNKKTKRKNIFILTYIFLYSTFSVALQYISYLHNNELVVILLPIFTMIFMLFAITLYYFFKELLLPLLQFVLWFVLYGVESIIILIFKKKQRRVFKRIEKVANSVYRELYRE